MSWIALTDLNNAAFNIRGIGVRADAPGARGPAGRNEILPTGTLMIELRAHQDPGQAWKVLRYRRKRDWVRDVSVGFDEAGALSVVVRQGPDRSKARIALPALPRDSRLRLSYTWNAPARTACLSVEVLDAGQIHQTRINNPVPLPIDDVRAITRNGAATRIDDGTCVVAFSDEEEPVGFGAGLTRGTPVETESGPVPIERLRLGDMVLTAGSGPQPVRWIAKRRVPAFGSYQPVRLRAPFFGLENDMLLAPDHRVRLETDEAEYLLGQQDVLISAGHLANGKHARRENRGRLITYYQVLLDVHDCLSLEGVWAESLFIGAIARRPDLVATTALAALPTTALPVHRGFVRRRLNDFEARTIAAAL